MYIFMFIGRDVVKQMYVRFKCMDAGDRRISSKLLWVGIFPYYNSIIGGEKKN